MSIRHYGDRSSGREEALADAIRRRPNLYGKLARLSRGEGIREAILVAATGSREPRPLLALLVIIGKFRQQTPGALAASVNGNMHRHEIDAAILTPLNITCCRLAGLHFERADRAAAEPRAWLLGRAVDGFDFSASLADELMALAALVELDEEIGDFAAAVLDKWLFTLALHPTEFAKDARLSP